MRASYLFTLSKVFATWPNHLPVYESGLFRGVPTLSIGVCYVETLLRWDWCVHVKRPHPDIAYP